MFGDKRMKIIGHQCHFQNQKEIKGMFRILIQHNSDKNVVFLISVKNKFYDMLPQYLCPQNGSINEFENH